MSAPSLRRLAAALAAVTVLALALRTAGLSAQPVIPDDLSVATTARQFTDAGLPEPTMWNHPRLRDHLVAASLDRLGDTPWGLKAWSVALGTLSVPAVALLVLAVGGGPVAAVLAALLTAVDGLHLDFSRQAINDVYLAFFPVAGLAAAWRYRAARRAGWLLAAGSLFGLGLASKWSAAFPLAAAAALVAADALRGPGTRREKAAELAFAGAALAALPLAIYLATFGPWFGRGYGLGDWLRFHGSMALETATHTGYAGTKRPGYEGELVGAWRWFLQPVWYADVSVHRAGQAQARIVGIGNPVAWLAVLPAAAWAAFRALRRGDRAALALLALFAIAYGPFALARRPIWTNSAVAVVPFAMALVGLALARLAEAGRRAVAGAFTAAALAAAAVLVAPAAGIATPAGDAVVGAVVPPIAFEPKVADAPGPRHAGEGRP
ncbi:MAG TPA: phospholipid carrier-dependent glycosyltransferase [Anaeromyxobacteraceae bacterium]|nr:phospholipid carrier-dependent glycosyltransferase [Anaeromyxobacteraceae bacterium]